MQITINLTPAQMIGRKVVANRETMIVEQADSTGYLMLISLNGMSILHTNVELVKFL